MPAKAITAALALFVALAVPVAGEESAQYKNLLTPILASGQTVLDQPIAYPVGTAKVTAAIVTIPPGGETGWHTHAVPLFVYILEGVVTVDYGDKGVKVYSAGEGILEAMNWPHDGRNLGSAPVKILAVYMGAEGATNTAVAPH
jgi:quercetin dioxygenase-like cupin family protein